MATPHPPLAIIEGGLCITTLLVTMILMISCPFSMLLWQSQEVIMHYDMLTGAMLMVVLSFFIFLLQS